ncbi:MULTISPECIES: hypothetical protein [Streptomyces]|uniref:hypothetical protein n=1 Tax=Streptomyces TaxID=1883 RepID=UPI0004CD9EBD|nr:MULTISPECIES: hypothetical protein [Streptomyces]KOT47125.1 hypothetical protein ADK43_40320 [Streptomyces rimosus subsp. rimosus]
MVSVSETKRRQLLAAAVARQPGEWTTRRVLRLYRSAGWPAPLSRTARHDLARLHRDGLLTLHETPGRRYYTRKDGVR